MSSFLKIILFFILLTHFFNRFIPLNDIEKFSHSKSNCLTSQFIDTNVIIENIIDEVLNIESHLDDFSVINKSIAGESTEGGIIEGYFNNKTIKKISVTYYGETGKSKKDFYFKEKKIIYGTEKLYYYSIPIYNKDSKIIDSIVNQYYFHNDSIIYFLSETDSIKIDKSKSKKILLETQYYLELLL